MDPEKVEDSNFGANPNEVAKQMKCFYKLQPAQLFCAQVYVQFEYFSLIDLVSCFLKLSEQNLEDDIQRLAVVESESH